MLQDDLLNDAKLETGSDYKTAKAIGISRQTLSNARHGVHKLELSTIGSLAELCGKDPLKTIAAVAAEREGQSKKGRNWRRWAGAATVTVAVGISSTSLYPTTSYAASKASNDVYIMRIISMVLSTFPNEC
ncbi:helix-turn-helix transcriptional regulator [Salinisphaera sp. SPP-AMP-43]|uniref:helix-turn-helix domain-containing protein n=1 Tax=Salinisphaera sp. SPP-AMP-43 TaxID=3121288 RepID=UPI003C6DFD27